MWAVGAIVLSYGLEVPGLEYKQSNRNLSSINVQTNSAGVPASRSLGTGGSLPWLMWPEHVLTTQYYSIAEDTNQWN
jgi:hypothetical protein